ncbi:DUF3298 and DUF4163 domain-containing protein [Pseudotamlana agarivorans]|uniref:DUF3298 and DUF4163 domain-containing protein n=1 Tax=Pseudotamlana agarivorans TaxID=481183 RepID=UPI00082A0863|nr:DUF3298 and DUF4163 domain-containing protein [Tamlana agarivorans]
MRNFKHLFIYLTVLLCLSCDKEFNISFSEEHISPKNNSIVEINIPKASGKESVAHLINQTIEQNVISSIQLGSIDNENIQAKSINESVTTFINEFESLKRDFPESPQIWEAQIDGEVLYQSKTIISIAITSYTNTGGAHGNLKITFLNFNAENGQLIANKTLFSDIDAVKKIAEPYYKKTIEDKSILLNQDQFILPSNMAYTEEGLVFLYNTFEIAAYSEGIIEFKVPYNEIESYLLF